MKRKSTTRFILASILLGWTFLASASSNEAKRPILYAYDYWAEIEIQKAIKNVEAKGKEMNADFLFERQECRNFMAPYIKDNVLDIRYSFGYFDDTTGSSIKWDNKDWGHAASADEGVFLAFKKVLTNECPHDSRKLCGFIETTSEQDRIRDGRSVLVRDIDIHGKWVTVRITMTYASASPFYEKNLSTLKDQQAHQTKISEQEFFGGVKEADMIIYNGHSRNGGGPDFNPPRLNSLKKVDYKGYYQKVRPGITRLVNELKNSPRKEIFVGMFSCDSRLHFQRRLLTQNKNQRMVLTANQDEFDEIHYFDTLKASVGYLEGFLRGGCGNALMKFALPESKLEKTFFQYGL